MTKPWQTEGDARLVKRPTASSREATTPSLPNGNGVGDDEEDGETQDREQEDGDANVEQQVGGGGDAGLVGEFDRLAPGDRVGWDVDCG